MVELEPIRSAASAASRSNIDTPATPSSTQSRSRGLPLSRIYSAQHLDDQSLYHHDDYDDSEDSEGTLADEDEKVPTDPVEQNGHVPGETAEQRDLEAGGAQLQKEKSARSAKTKDPNLVCQHPTLGT